ncbi:zinc carboxypeptidase [bacterium]|nr:zinc carboxypeptidase [bacterium]
MKKIIFILLILSQIYPYPLYSQSTPEQKLITVSKKKETVEKLLQWNADVLMERKGKIYILARPKDLNKLQSNHIPYTMEKLPSSTPLGSMSSQNGINGAYHSYSELERDLLTLEEKHPQTVKVFNIGDTLEKRNIYALKISDHVQMDEQEAEVIFLGCHHAREWISVEVPLLLGKHLAENYSTDPQIQEIVNQSEIWIVPLVNPDGLHYSIYFYRYWRKNRRNNEDGTYGVDLNRNYDYKWGFDNKGSSPQSSSNVYRGNSPFSEPETQSIRDLFSIKNFQALISYHSYSQIILYPWGYTTQPSPKDEMMENMAAQMSALMKPVSGRVYRYGQAGASLYLTNGDTTDWALGDHNIPSFTIELPPVDILHGGFFNSEEDIHHIFRENLPAALYLIRWAIQEYSPSSLPPEPSSRNSPLRKERK